jgi:carbon storage regulator CsrA
MLVLSRKINESIVIGGNIRITATAIRSHQVRLAIDAPPEVPIVREELVDAPKAGGSDRGCLPAARHRVRPDANRRGRGVRHGR